MRNIPPTEAGHEARRNIYERLLAYAQKADAKRGHRRELRRVGRRPG